MNELISSLNTLNIFLGTTSALDILIHGGNSAGMLIELLVVRHPVYIFQFVYSIGFGIIYIIFTIIYYFTGGLDPQGKHYIYNVLNWSEPGKAALVTFGIAVLLIVLHIVTCIIQKLRHRIHKRVFRKTAMKVTDLNKSSQQTV